MEISFNNIIKSNAFVEATASLKLLRARNLSLITTFLYSEYKTNQQITIPYQKLIQRLGDFLEEINYTEEDEEIMTGRIILGKEQLTIFYLNCLMI